MSAKSLATGKVVLITGASSGVGAATAHTLSARGHRVFGGSRSLLPSTDGPFETLTLDVKDAASVRSAVEAMLTKAGRIDVLINNAGYELFGALEESSIEEAKELFETNFFGAKRLIDAALPAMRSARAGQIINVGSLAGMAPIPFMGIYSASKFALQGYSQALRWELRSFGIAVSVVMPGFLNTPMQTNRRTVERAINDYGHMKQRSLRSIEAAERKGPGAESVARIIAGVVEARRPKFRYLAGRQARNTALLSRLLPEGPFEMGARKNFDIV